MPREALKANLDRLRRELDEPGSLDETTRKELAEVADTIERILETRPADYSDAQASIEDAALRFEARHPSFARILSEVTDALAKLGI